MLRVGLLAYGENSYTALKTLIKEFRVLWILTPSGQTNLLSVEKLAKEEKIKIVRSNSEKEIEALIKEEIPEIVVIASYNKILSDKVLKLTKFINIHHGDLPRFRGRANINWAIINGRKKIGLSFHEAVSDLDSGNIYKQIMVKISDKDTVKTVYEKFNILIEKNLNNVVKKVYKGFKGKKQIGKTTYCCTRLPQDGLIDWNLSTKQIDRFVRALTKPYPGAFTYFFGEKVVIWDCEVPQNPKIYEGRIPGRVIEIHKDKGVEVLTGDGSIIIKKINYKNEELIADQVIKTVKVSLGINWVELYESLQRLNNES